MISDKKIIEKISELLKTSENFVLAIVIDTWKSAPKPVGSTLLFCENGEISGSVSGGCVESAVITEAKISLDTKKSKILKFGITNEDAFNVGLACGGEITILIEPIIKVQNIKRKLLESFFNNYFQGALSIYKICLKSSQRELIVDEKALNLLSNNKKHDKESFKDKENFFYVLPPKNKMVIVGAVHIAQFLVELANQFNYEIIVIDPRSTFANNHRFPDVEIINDWPDDAFKKIKLDHDTAIVTLTHDPKIDDIALKLALNCECFYIGSLGSKKTHEKRINRLQEMGINQKNIKRIHAPIGLDIGSKNPNEIALSIMAEIIKERRFYNSNQH